MKYDLEIKVIEIEIVVGDWGEIYESDMKDVLIGIGMEELVNERE